VKEHPCLPARPGGIAISSPCGLAIRHAAGIAPGPASIARTTTIAARAAMRRKLRVV